MAPCCPRWIDARPVLGADGSWSLLADSYDRDRLEGARFCPWCGARTEATPEEAAAMLAEAERARLEQAERTSAAWEVRRAAEFERMAERKAACLPSEDDWSSARQFVLQEPWADAEDVARTLCVNREDVEARRAAR